MLTYIIFLLKYFAGFRYTTTFAPVFHGIRFKVRRLFVVMTSNFFLPKRTGSVFIEFLICADVGICPPYIKSYENDYYRFYPFSGRFISEYPGGSAARALRHCGRHSFPMAIRDRFHSRTTEGRFLVEEIQRPTS